MSNKLIRLGKSGIEYLDYVWNFCSGCRHKEQGLGPNGAEAKCPPVPCWAAELCKRFKGHYPNGFAPTFYPEAFLSPLALKGEGKRIGVCFMGDLFGDWVDPEELFAIPVTSPDYKYGGYASLKTHIKVMILGHPQHTFIFLTKNPAGMIPWGPFPDNCRVGFSAWSPESFIEGLRQISRVEAKVKWCSLEPLLDWTDYFASNAWELLDWVVLGALTGTKKQIEKANIDCVIEKYKAKPEDRFLSCESILPEGFPISNEELADLSALTPRKLSAKGNRWGLMPPVAWLKTIVEGCAAAKVPVFLKDNLYTWLNELPLGEEHDLFFEDMSHLRQELPIIYKDSSRTACAEPGQGELRERSADADSEL